MHQGFGKPLNYPLQCRPHPGDPHPPVAALHAIGDPVNQGEKTASTWQGRFRSRRSGVRARSERGKIGRWEESRGARNPRREDLRGRPTVTFPLRSTRLRMVRHCRGRGLDCCGVVRILLCFLLSTISIPHCSPLSSSLPRPCLRALPRSGVLRLRGGLHAAGGLQQQGSSEEDLFLGLMRAVDKGKYLSEMYNKVYDGAESGGFVHRQQVLLLPSLPPSIPPFPPSLI